MGGARVSGLEPGLRGTPLPWRDLGGKFTVLEQENRSDPDTRMTRVPDRKLFAHAVLRPRHGVSLQATVEYSSRRWVNNTASVGDFTIFGLKASWKPAAAVTIEAGVDKALDRNDELDAGFPAAGRSWFVQARYETRIPVGGQAMTPKSGSAELCAAAIEDDGSCDLDALLADLACRQRRAGRRVRGLIMTHPDGGTGCARPMVLLDVETLEEYLVSQPLGRDSTSCRADPQGFARASAVLRHALDDAPDLVVSNRFGGLEAEGGGFHAELLDILCRGVPLLTVVATRHVEAWRSFTGGAAVLPPRADAVEAWLAARADA